MVVSIFFPSNIEGCFCCATLNWEERTSTTHISSLRLFEIDPYCVHTHHGRTIYRFYLCLCVYFCFFTETNMHYTRFVICLNKAFIFYRSRMHTRIETERKKRKIIVHKLLLKWKVYLKMGDGFFVSELRRRAVITNNTHLSSVLWLYFVYVYVYRTASKQRHHSPIPFYPPTKLY